MSITKYQDYRDSGVEWLGNVPLNWELLGGKRLFYSRRESSLKEDEQLAASQEHGVIPQALMMILNNAKVMLALKGTSTFRHVEAGDFVISLRSFEGGIEYSSYSGCVSPAYTVLASRKLIVREYYRFLFKSGPFVAALQSTTDSLRDGKAISFGQFSEISLPIPSLAEQTQIAKFLDYETSKIDALIEKQQQLIALLKEKRQAVISHAVTKGLNPDAPMRDSGVEWLGDVPAHWKTATIRHVTAEHKQGYYTKDAYIEKGTPLLRITDIAEDTSIDFSSCPELAVPETDRREFGLSVGDFVFVRSGASIGKFGIVEEDVGAIFGSYTIRFGFHKNLQRGFLKWYFQSSTFLNGLFSTLHGGAIKNINAENIKNQLIGIPPRDEQIAIAEQLDEVGQKMRLLVAGAEQGIELLQERRTALISAAVTGKIDVRNWQAPESENETEAA